MEEFLRENVTTIFLYAVILTFILVVILRRTVSLSATAKTSTEKTDEYDLSGYSDEGLRVLQEMISRDWIERQFENFDVDPGDLEDLESRVRQEASRRGVENFPASVWK